MSMHPSVASALRQSNHRIELLHAFLHLKSLFFQTHQNNVTFLKTIKKHPKPGAHV